MGVDQEPLQNGGTMVDDKWSYKAVFGLPWDCEQFISKAVEAGHPSKLSFAVPECTGVANGKRSKNLKSQSNKTLRQGLLMSRLLQLERGFC